jgi:hypothetical protein
MGNHEMKTDEILQIKPIRTPFGFFDKKGKFQSIRAQQRKFMKVLKQVSGINTDLLGCGSEEYCLRNENKEG